MTPTPKSEPADPTSDATRARLLEAAGEIFAQQGFRVATVRQICRRAKANVASVNYHFGDKAGLYAEVLRYAHTCANERFPVDRGLAPDSPAADRLRGFVRAFVERQFDEGRSAWLTQLMQREMMEPTEALDRLAQNQFRPMFERLQALVRELLGKGAGTREVQLGAMSVLGQCLFHTLARSVIERVAGTEHYNAKIVTELTEHITRFSLAALRGYRVETSGGKGGSPGTGSGSSGRGSAGSRASGAGEKQ
ncbi:MAG: CerR family C-terminal domain-containing protein [Planctomycetota bacterium]